MTATLASPEQPRLQSAPRYAIYFTTRRGHPLTRAAEKWLGRSAFAESDTAMSPHEAAIVSEPRRYGFHATLKAPFRLADGRSIDEIEEELHEFCGETWSCPIGPLRVDVVRGFLALTPSREISRLTTLASSIVERFDHFRASFSANELKRRLNDPVDDDEASNLVRWGYPYVFDRFKFHLTLTNKIAPEKRPALVAELESRLGRLLEEDYRVDRLTLFEQPNQGADFVVRKEFEIRGGLASAL